MIAYFDTSALVPLIVDEPGSPLAGQLWDEADRVVSVRLIYPEACAALAQARRMDRLTSDQLAAAVTHLDGLYEQLDRIEVDEQLVRRAGQLAQERDLRGYDAIHLAGAQRVGAEDTVVATGDVELSAAAHAVGLATTTVA